MKIHQLLPLLVIASTLTACAAGGKHIQIEDDIRKSIKTVSIESDVATPNSIQVNSATQNVAANFGLIGMMVGDGDKRERTKEVKSAMEKQGIDISALVYQKFSREMAKRTPYKPLKEGSSSDATMSIRVHLIGLDVAGVGKRMYPQLTVSAEMKNPKGKTIWRNSGTVGPLQKKNEAKYTYDELIAEPKRLQEIMTSVAGLVAEKVMAEL